MRMMRSAQGMLPWASLAVGLALLVSACTGGGRTASHRTSTTTTTAGGSTTSSSTPAAAACTTAHLALAVGTGNGAAGTGYTDYFLRNTGSANCSLSGFPGLAVLDANGNVVQRPATRCTGTTGFCRPVMTVLLQPGQSTTFLGTNVDVYPTTDCPTHLTGTTVQVYPPGQTVPLRQPWTVPNNDVCDLGVGPVQPVPRCHTSDLTAEIQPGGAAAGNIGATLHITDMSRPCFLFGYPGLQMLDGSGQPMRTRVVRGSSMLHHDPGPSYVTLDNGEVASAGIGYSDVAIQGDPANGQCPGSSSVEVTPPDETTYLSISAGLGPCDGGRLFVTAFQTGGQPRGAS